jgi:IS5 family transposase
MLRMYLLQVWFPLSDEGVEDAIYDSYAMRRFMGLDLMHQTKKGNQWYFGMKAHLGADAGTGYAHTVTATAANVHDLDEAPNLVRTDDETVYADAGYQGASKRPEITEDEHLSKIEWRIASPQGRAQGDE